MVPPDPSGGSSSELPVEPDRPTNVLVLAPSMEPAVDDACADLLSWVEPDATDLLLVTTDQSPDERLATWRSAGGGRPPAKAAIVTVGEGTRSAAAREGADVSPERGGFHRTTVSEPGDLTGLGIRVSRALETWRDDGNVPVVCVRSLTDLLLYADRWRVFRFLHILTGLVETVGGIAHCHIYRDAHDERTIATFRSLFDVVLRYRDGTWHRE